MNNLVFLGLISQNGILVYETQNPIFVTEALVNLQEMKVIVPHSCHALSVAFCIQHCSGAQRIVLLESSHLTYSCGQNLFFALSSSESLKSLHLKDILFEDDGKMLPCEILKEKKCQLETLRCGGNAPWRMQLVMSPVFFRIIHPFIHGASLPDWCFAVVNIENLKNLDMSYNCLEENKMKMLCEALRKQDCKLQTLSLVSSKLTPVCYMELFSALSGNKSLKYLDLSENVIK